MDGGVMRIGTRRTRVAEAKGKAAGARRAMRENFGV